MIQGELGAWLVHWVLEIRYVVHNIRCLVLGKLYWYLVYFILYLLLAVLYIVLGTGTW